MGPSPTVREGCVLMWTSAGWQERLFLGASLTTRYRQQSVSLSDTHSPRPRQLWFLPLAPALWLLAPVHPLSSDSWLPGQYTSADGTRALGSCSGSAPY